MRLIFKIFALPFLLVLSLLVAVLMFLFEVAGWPGGFCLWLPGYWP
ncbi:hypothetical protein [Enterocloster bolteae]|mgnify:FL=1|uniref:Uncharacterized protein n=2 Tax=Enterocloster bolteae TaxID=208479 RepID=R0BQI1_9FIRM|nr:hypothetical protein [Enterocloster bolteae]ENZ44469.1 hypothetical protein HMPREF1089_01061 [Enterocloster bolteae 90B3]ENZ50928.1 hypothetical protein HMPREF1085_02415 [Enterocloster bolteae 90A9]MCG4900377.1 hypothetical protein [Enterocloster bolteae]UOX70885.1 hypothetical protein K4205_04300 [Enterocloster bolteae]